MNHKKIPPYESEKEAMMRSRIITITLPNGKIIEAFPIQMPDGKIKYLELS